MAALGLSYFAQALSSCGEQRLLSSCGAAATLQLWSSGYSAVVERGLLTAVTSLLRSTGSGAQAQQLWRTGLMALQQVESSRTRD